MQGVHLHKNVLCRRRTVLGVGLAVAPVLVTAAQAEDGTDAPPRLGDRLVFITGPKKGEPIRSLDLPMGGPSLQAYPADPNGTVRDGSRLNLVILARVGDNGVNDETRGRMADDVVAYSGICTHQACPVNMWSVERHAFVCTCHASTYDPKNDAEVISGPAPRHLAALPLTSEDGVLTVAGGFIGHVGMSPT